MIARALSIAGAALIALAAGKIGLLAVAPLAALLWFRAVDGAADSYARHRARGERIIRLADAARRLGESDA